MCAIQQVVLIGFLLTTGVLVMSRPYDPRPFEYQLHRMGSTESLDFSQLDERSSFKNDSLSAEETAISILFKIKFFPFRKSKEQLITIETARFGGPYTGVGEGSEDNGIWGAGIDFGLPDGSGFGYGEEGPFKTFSLSSLSRVSYVANIWECDVQVYS